MSGCCGGGEHDHGHGHFDETAAAKVRMVNCVKFGREMEGLSEVPWNNDLGRRIFNEVSIEAWKMWQSQETMIINEYHLQLWKPDDRKKLYAMCESFLFGGGLQPPPEYVAPDAALAHGEEHAHHHYPHG